MSWEVRTGDCIELMKAMEPDSVDCVVTSPPYWGLRDYGVDGAWGLEPTLAEYMDRMRSLGEALMRVLKPSGTFWLNLGDAYCNTNGYARAQAEWQRPGRNGAPANDRKLDALHAFGLKTKDLIGLPWRVAFALQGQGWYLRSEIIWHKPNPMPESVTDRPTRSHEQVFLLTKSARYWYDADAIADPITDISVARLLQPNYENQEGSHRVHGMAIKGKRMKAVVKSGPNSRIHKSRNPGGAVPQLRDEWETDRPTRNSRSVWTIATQPYHEAHFATFPEELPKRCILAGCPEGGLVFDPFTGSGTTGAVAVRLGRRFIGSEVNPAYIELAERRIKAETPSLFTEAGQALETNEVKA